MSVDSCDERSAVDPMWRTPIGRFWLICIGWTVVAVALAVQGLLTSASAGAAQPWWPSFGYSLAIAFVWAGLTPAAIVCVRRTLSLVLYARVALLLIGFAAISVIHAAAFSLLFWPIYGDGQHEGLASMAEHMVVRNIGQTALFYVGLVVVAWRLRSQPAERGPPVVLTSRQRGAVRRVDVEAVLWIRSAGNYAEAVLETRTVLLDDSLATLGARLCQDRFARVHRTAIVRLDAIRELRRRGHGDADLVLVNGDVVRMSRRYGGAVRQAFSGK